MREPDVGPRSPRRAPQRCPARRSAPFPARRMPEAPRGPRPSSPSCDSQVRAASRYVLPTSRSWVSTTASATNVSHSTGAEPRESRGGGCPGARGARRRSSAPPCRRSRVIRCGGMSPKRPSGTARRRRCSRRSSSRLASAELLPGSNCRSHTNRVTPASTVSSSRCSRSSRQPGRHPLGDAGLDAAFRVDERSTLRGYAIQPDIRAVRPGQGASRPDTSETV